MKTRKIFAFILLAVAALGFACGARQTPEAAAQLRVRRVPVDSSTVGAVTGVIYFRGTPPRRPFIQMNEDPACVKLQLGRAPRAQDGEVNPDGTLPNTFVYVMKGAGKYDFSVPSRPVVLREQGCIYKPHVLGIMAGQVLEVENEDPTTHNFHPIPRFNAQQNIAQPPGSPPLIERFSHPEVMIPIECTQHPWMRCYLGVVRNPLYSVTGKRGAYMLRGMPPGRYTIGAWTATFGKQEKKVTVLPKQTSTLDFTFRPLPG